MGRRAAPSLYDAGDVIGALRAHARLIFDYLELGRPMEADAQIAAHGKIADELGLQRYQWLTFMMRALRAITDGRFEESEALRERARRIRQRVKSAEMDAAYYIQSWGPAIARGAPLPNVQEIDGGDRAFPERFGDGFHDSNFRARASRR